MTETTQQPTAAELNELQADLDRKKANLSIQKIAEATVALETHEAQELLTTLSEIAANMPDSSARSQLQSTASILASCNMVLAAERDRNQRILDGNTMTMPPIPGMMPPVVTPPAPPAE